MTKITKTIIALAASGLLSFQAHGGTISYVPIPSTNSDTGVGISPDNVYTSAIEAGNTTGTDQVVNGVTLTSLQGTGNTSTAGGITVNALSGSLSNGTGATGNVEADGVFAGAMQTMISNVGAADGSQQEVVLDPATLTAGKTYDLRVYIASSGNQDREVDLSFACDAQAPVETGFFNEDDATTSPGAFADKNQVYYINYRFTWDGATTPGITITQKSGATPFLLYALTNQEATATAAPQPVAVDQEPVGSGPGQDVGVESDQFYDNDGLNSHGRWIIVGRYGRCWQPGDVGADWAPYTRGYWAHSNYGWTWVSNQDEDDWGWATYHYGRWCHVDGAGWCWVPGRVWAPAWVSWRSNDSCVGWAPLPPDAICADGVGISVWADSSYGLGPGAYNFVSVQNFGAPDMAAVLFARQRNVEFIQSTANVTNIVNRNTVIYNGGPDVNAINAAIIHQGGHPVPTGLVLNRRGTAGPLGSGKFSQLQGNVLTLAGPRVASTKNLAGLKPPAATFAAPKFDKGWNQVSDPKAAADLKKKIAQDAKGKTPKTTKAVLPTGVALAPANVVAGAASPAGLHPGKAFKKGAAGSPAPGAAAGPLHPGQKLSQVVPTGQKGIPNTVAPGAKHPGQALNPAVVPGAQPAATPLGGFHPGQKLVPATTAATAQPTATPKKHGKTAVVPVATPTTAAPALVHPGQTLPAAGTNTAQPTPTPKKHGKQSVTPPPAAAPAAPNGVTAPQHTPVPKPPAANLQQAEAAAAAKQQQQAAAAAAAKQQQAGVAADARQQQQAAAAAAAKQQQAGAAAEARQQQQAAAAAAAKQQQQAAAAQQQQAAARQQQAAAAAAAAKQQQAAAAARGGKPGATPTPTPH